MPRPDLAQYSTSETRRKGALRANEVRRERAKSFRQRLAEKLEAEADEVFQSFARAYREGDWRAAQAIIREAFGQPAQHFEGNQTVTVVVPSVVPPQDEPVEAEVVPRPDRDAVG